MQNNLPTRIWQEEIRRLIEENIEQNQKTNYQVWALQQMMEEFLTKIRLTPKDLEQEKSLAEALRDINTTLTSVWGGQLNLTKAVEARLDKIEEDQKQILPILSVLKTR